MEMLEKGCRMESRPKSLKKRDKNTPNKASGAVSAKIADPLTAHDVGAEHHVRSWRNNVR